MSFKSFLFFLFLISFPLHLKAQKLEELLEMDWEDKINVKIDDKVYYITVYNENQTKKIHENRYYYWYKGNKIKRTKGGYDGKLLNDEFKVFDLNKNLIEQGRFYYGLKNGKWINWFNTGEIKSITNWRKGLLHGKSRQYDSKGNMIENMTYKRGLKSGKQIFTDSISKVVTVLDYKKDVLIIPVKKNIVSKNNIKPNNTSKSIPAVKPGSKPANPKTISRLKLDSLRKKYEETKKYTPEMRRRDSLTRIKIDSIRIKQIESRSANTDRKSMIDSSLNAKPGQIFYPSDMADTTIKPIRPPRQIKRE